MRLTVQPRIPGQIELSIIFGTIALLALVSARLLPGLEIMPSCPFRAITGIPCPSCGITRSLVHLAHGDISGSLFLNPLFSLALLFSIFLFFARLASLPFKRSAIKLVIMDREYAYVRVATAGIFLANWIYLIARL